MSGYNIKLDRNSIDPLNIMLDHITANSKILEFGCANGRMTHYLHSTLHCNVDIVEYDPELFKLASQYASDGICGDITTFEWCDKFAGQKYDYIIFADVLEHLRNTEDVLKRCQDFLADNGIIWISVPNIAHNDIIAKLYSDTFDYTKTGLLDSTHVHFFTRKTARALFEHLGYHIIYEDGICVHTFCTEQLLSTSVTWNPYYNHLLEREYGELYQCIFAISKNEFKIPNLNNNANWDIQKNLIEERIYFDYGSGFQDHIYTQKNYSDCKLNISITVSPKTQLIWICPAFRRRFIIEDLLICADGQNIDYCEIRAEKVENKYFFNNLDGSIYINNIENISNITITGKITLDVNFELMEHIAESKKWQDQLESSHTELQSLQNSYNQLAIDYKEDIAKYTLMQENSDRLRQELLKESDRKSEEINLLKNDIQKKSSCIEDLETVLESKEQTLQSVQENYDLLKDDLQRKCLCIEDLEKNLEGKEQDLHSLQEDYTLLKDDLTRIEQSMLGKLYRWIESKKS